MSDDYIFKIYLKLFLLIQIYAKETHMIEISKDYPPLPPARHLHSIGYMCQDWSDNLFSDRIVIVSKSNPPQKCFSDDTSTDLLHMTIEGQFVNR